MKKIIQEFKDFALQGNAFDMAVGIIIGGAFGKIVDTFVDELVIPPIGMLLGGIDFSTLAVTLQSPISSDYTIELKYGMFINTVINFAILAFAMFSVIKTINSVKRKKEKPAPSKQCPECHMEIPIKAKRCGHCASTLH